MAESVSDFRITTDIPYLAPTGELWGVFCEDFGENWPRYNGTALYISGHGDSLRICLTWTNADLTLKQLKMHGYILITVAADALVLNHQGINSYSTDKILIVIDQFHLETLLLKRTITFWKNNPIVKGLIVNSSPPSATYMCQWIGSALVQIMACCLFGAKPLSNPTLGYC